MFLWYRYGIMKGINQFSIVLAITRCKESYDFLKMHFLSPILTRQWGRKIEITSKFVSTAQNEHFHNANNVSKDVLFQNRESQWKVHLSKHTTMRRFYFICIIYKIIYRSQLTSDFTSKNYLTFPKSCLYLYTKLFFALVCPWLMHT